MNRMAIHMSFKLHFVQYQYRVIIIYFPYCKEVHSPCRDGMLSRSAEYSRLLCGKHGYRLRFIHVCKSVFPHRYLARINAHLNFNFQCALTTADEATTGRLLLDFQIMNRQISNAQTTMSNDDNFWVTHWIFKCLMFLRLTPPLSNKGWNVML